MTGAGFVVPAHATTDVSGMDEIAMPIDPITNPGTLLFVEPALWRGDPAVVPTGSIPNQSGWAPDIVPGAATLTLTNGLVNGKAERGSKGSLHAAHKRGAGLPQEVLTIASQPIRDYMVANWNHRFLIAMSFQITRIPDPSWAPAASQRMMGLVDGTQNRATIGVNATRDTISAYPTGDPPRKIVQSVSMTTGIGIAAGAFEYTAAPTVSASPTLVSFHNGGTGGPASCFKLFFAIIEDLTVSGRLASERIAELNARHQQEQGNGGRYFGDTHTNPATL